MNSKTNTILKWVGFCLSIYQITIGLVGTPTSLIHRPLTVGILMLFLFLKDEKDGKKSKWGDWVLAIASLLVCLYAVVNANWFLSRFPYLTPVKLSEYIYGIALILLVLEAGRRSMGWVMPTIGLVMILYALFGHLLGGALWHTQFKLSTVIEQITMTTEGIWGSPTHSAVTVVFMFVLFGAVLNSTGTGEFFMDLSLCLTGRFCGATAKTAVVSSGLMGMIQGSSISNVVTTGTFTIPAMIKAGFPDYFAGAVETVATCGGQIMPPVMGSIAFVMAEYTGVSYLGICKAALLPALLYYGSLFTMIHFEACRCDLGGTPQDLIPPKREIMKKLYYLAPLAILIATMMSGRSIIFSAISGSLSAVILSCFRRETRLTPGRILAVIESTASNILMIAACCACVGIIIGVVTMTGFGFGFVSIMGNIARVNMTLFLLVLMLTCIVFGMGLPSLPAYILVATFGAPALVQAGIPLISAHLFVMYFAITSGLTPPVCLIAYAGAAIADANPMKTGFTAFKLAIAAYIVPYIFIFEPALLLMGDWLTVAQAVVTAVTGVVCLASAMQGWLLIEANRAERLLMFAAGLSLLYPGTITDIAGLASLALVAASQLARRRRLPPRNPGECIPSRI